MFCLSVDIQYNILEIYGLSNLDFKPQAQGSIPEWTFQKPMSKKKWKQKFQQKQQKEENKRKKLNTFISIMYYYITIQINVPTHMPYPCAKSKLDFGM